jgi:hypothetical protein
MQRGSLLFFVLLLHTPFAHADPIPIRVTGSLDLAAPPGTFESLGHLDLVGRGDFRVTEVVVAETMGGVTCAPCAPGDFLNLGGAFAEDFGSVTLGGVTYAIPSDAGVGSSFFANGVAPAFGSNGVLTVPFTYLGFFSPPGREFELRGQGMATVRFRPDHGGSSPLWDFDGARFQFAPTPEPGTLLLISSGMAVLAWRRRACRQFTDHRS